MALFFGWINVCYKGKKSVREKVNYFYNNSFKLGLEFRPENRIWSNYRNYAGYKQVALKIDIAG